MTRSEELRCCLRTLKANLPQYPILAWGMSAELSAVIHIFLVYVFTRSKNWYKLDSATGEKFPPPKRNTMKRPTGPMARRLTTNQEIAGSIPALVKIFGRSGFLFGCLMQVAGFCLAIQ